MKAIIMLGVTVCLLGFGCASRDRLVAAPAETPKIRAREHAQDRPEPILYLHLLAPRYHADPPIPPQRILTTRVCLNEDMTIAVGAQGEVLSGRIEKHGDKFYARLQGKSVTTMNRFDGEMALDRLEVSQGGGFSSAIWSVLFLLTTNSDCSPVLRRLDGPFDPELYNESLRRQERNRPAP